MTELWPARYNFGKATSRCMHICGARGDRERRITCTRLGAFARLFVCVCSFRVIVCLLQKVKTNLS
jgi:hypothetical protein